MCVCLTVIFAHLTNMCLNRDFKSSYKCVSNSDFCTSYTHRKIVQYFVPILVFACMHACKDTHTHTHTRIHTFKRKGQKHMLCKARRPQRGIHIYAYMHTNTHTHIYVRKGHTHITQVCLHGSGHEDEGRQNTAHQGMAHEGHSTAGHEIPDSAFQSAGQSELQTAFERAYEKMLREPPPSVCVWRL
jgi:hypothetical protein